MVLPKASIGNSASFQIAGTPYVYTASANKTIDFKYVTRAITVQSTGAANKISFDGGTNEMTLVQNKVYRLDTKCKQLKITCVADTAVSVVAELTSVESWQATTIVQNNYVTIYGCTDSTASNYNEYAEFDDGSCSFSYTLGADPTALFHFDGNTTEACSSIVTATAANAIAYSTGKFTNAFDFNGTNTTLTFDATGVTLGTTACADNPLCLDGEYTIDFWIKLNSATRSMMGGNYTTTGIFSGTPYGTSISGKTEHLAMLYLDSAVASMFGLSANYISLSTFGTPYNDGVVAVLPSDPTDVWHHIAVTRDSSFVVKFFFDGVALEMLQWGNWTSVGTSYTELTGNDSGNGYPNRTTVLNTLLWGGAANAVSMAYNGELDEFRITKGTAIDFANTGKPTGPYTCS
jgi:hypothetical protein